jgi:hypothetical protein
MKNFGQIPDHPDIARTLLLGYRGNEAEEDEQEQYEAYCDRLYEERRDG